LLTTLAVLASLAGDASAHAEIESCQPPINGSVELPPDKIVCTTTESMDGKRSSLRVFDSAGAQVDKSDSQVRAGDNRIISISLDAAKIRDGVYTIKWKTLSADDGDEAGGEFKFTVGR
jgi:methionine-rich copper-binding protein CopC